MSGSTTTGKRDLLFSASYQAFPRQRQFHSSPAKYRLFGGAAGPGKTKALLWEAIGQAQEVAGCDTLLLRRTYPELESSLLAYFRRDVPRSMYKSYNQSKHLVTWTNGSTTKFGHCRCENDVYQYQGAEFLFIGIDELTHFTLKQWQFLTSRNRCPARVYSNGKNAGKRIVPCMAGATNPGNIGHAWVKALWVDHVPPAGFEQPHRYDPNDYDFIRARLDDNPIYADDAEYRRTLETLPEHLRRAFLEGDWNVFAGQYFVNFDYGRHTARPEEIRLEPWWTRWISIDWGFQHPSAVYWHCAVPATSGAAGARIATYREFVQNGLSPRMLAQAIAERSGRERICEVFLSPDAFAQRTSEASIAEQLGDVLVANGLPQPAPADDDRVGGWQLMYQLMESDSWIITDNCARLIECLPLLVSDEIRGEDIRKVEGDDPADAARYGLVSGVRLAGVRTSVLPSRAGQAPPFDSPPGTPHFVHGMPLEEQIARQISAQDPTSRAIHSQRLQHEANKFFQPKKFPRRQW
jgi:phage terminase large subunit